MPELFQGSRKDIDGWFAVGGFGVGMIVEVNLCGWQPALPHQEVADAELAVGLGGGCAGVGGEFVEVVEAGARGPRGKSGLALLGEAFLEAGEDGAGEWIARRNGTARAGIAAFEVNFTNRETNDAALVFAEELVFPKCRNVLDFHRSAEA